MNSGDVSMGQALWRGFLSRCPNCGEGKLFRKFLKVADNCNHCGQPLHHHRADDMPAYVVILILGHIIVPMLVTIELVYHPPYWMYAAVGLPGIVFIGLALLQPVKGLIVAFQWKKGMHGFHRPSA